jgi:hypothetical protein
VTIARQDGPRDFCAAAVAARRDGIGFLWLSG